MVVSDAQRRRLFELARETWGEEGAGTLMELLPPVGWGDVARQSDLTALRGKMAELRGEMAELRAELRGEMAELRGEMAELRGEMGSMLPKLVAANIASMVGVSGLVIAAAQLL